MGWTVGAALAAITIASILEFHPECLNQNTRALLKPALWGNALFVGLLEILLSITITKRAKFVALYASIAILVLVTSGMIQNY